MITRRRTVQTGLATLLSAAAPFRAFAQSKPRTKVRYSEVVHSILYAPAYVALAKGFFEEAGLDVTMTTAQGGDKSLAIMVTNQADIGLIGPETAIYVQNSDSPTKIPIFCGLTATDGFMLVGREKVDKFDWNMLRGKEILGFRPGSTPLLFLEAALRKNGLDPHKDVKLMNNVGIPARVGSWLAGQNQYAIFIEPDAAQLELDGKAHYLASIGETVGFADYTTFMATQQIHQGTSRGSAELDQRHRQGDDMDRAGPDPGAGQDAGAVLPRREPEGDDGSGRALPHGSRSGKPRR